MDYVEQIITIFKDLYLQHKGIPYISLGKGGMSAGKDRQSVGVLLNYIKTNSKDSLDSEQMLKKFTNLFVACFSIKEGWLSDNMTLSIISSKINEIILTLKNGNAKKTFYKGYSGDSNKWNRIFTELQSEISSEVRQISGGKSLAKIRNTEE